MARRSHVLSRPHPLVWVALSLAVTVAACSSDSSTDQADAEPTSTASPTATPEPTPVPTATPIPTATPTPEPTPTPTTPPALVVDATGEDFDRIYRELDGAKRYLSENPTAADPYRFFEPSGGGDTLTFFAERGLAREPARPGDSAVIDAVQVQSRVADDYVQLWVTKTVEEQGRRVLDADGTTRWEDLGSWSVPQDWLVMMRRTDGQWRIEEERALVSPVPVNTEVRALEEAQMFIPDRLVPVDETTKFTEGAVTGVDGNDYLWEGHWYVVSDNGDHCVEVRIVDGPRNVQCLSAEHALLMRENLVYNYDVIRHNDLTFFLGFAPNLPVDFQIDFGTSGETTLRPSASNGIGVVATLSPTWMQHVSFSLNGRFLGEFPGLGSYVCNGWSPGGSADGNLFVRYGVDGADRQGSRDLLEKELLRNFYDWYAAPIVDILREEPPTFDPEVFAEMPDEPTWYVLTASDWDLGVGERSRTWAFVFAEDDRGWYLAEARYRQDCPAGSEG